MTEAQERQGLSRVHAHGYQRVSPTYWAAPRPIWRKLLWHRADRAFDFALDNAGNNSDAKIAMIAITTRSSIKVKARGCGFRKGFTKSLDGEGCRRSKENAPHRCG